MGISVLMVLVLDGIIAVVCPLLPPHISNAGSGPLLPPHQDDIWIHHQHVVTLQVKPSEMCRLPEPKLVSIGSPNSSKQKKSKKKKKRGKIAVAGKRRYSREPRTCATCHHTTFHNSGNTWKLLSTQSSGNTDGCNIVQDFLTRWSDGLGTER